MCGIVAAISDKNVAPMLLHSLQQLEYRGYDSAGIAVIGADNKIARMRVQGKVSKLAKNVAESEITANIGIAHTRWATHGKPSVTNAHPHASKENIAVVHNGIIENFSELRLELQQAGYVFATDTDTEVIPHLLDYYLNQGSNVLKSMQQIAVRLEGAFAIAALINTNSNNEIYVMRKGSPIVIGIGENENFVASDQLALINYTNKFIALEDGDIANIKKEKVEIYDASGAIAPRPIKQSKLVKGDTDKGDYAHYMLKEVFEQQQVAANIIANFKADKLAKNFSGKAEQIFKKVKAVQIVACGTSYHAGLVAKYWLEELAQIPCNVEVASEFRYRKHAVLPNSLLVAISQSGETADTLAAIRDSAKNYAGVLAICNVAESSITREADMVFLTNAGPEIGVASTKAFTSQLLALLLLTINIGKYHALTADKTQQILQLLRQIPLKIEHALTTTAQIKAIANKIAASNNTLYVARGNLFPLALEGALKLKEISYIHAEAYAAGELKHGPLALVDSNMPVIAVVASGHLLEKTISNLQEVKARDGKIIVITDEKAAPQLKPIADELIICTTTEEILAPIVYTIPLQLLAYYVALKRGTDIDQPRNLAKSVTVE